MYKAILSINNREEWIVFPFLPPDIGPQQEQNNDTYNGLSKDYNTIGTMGLWQMSWSSFFPVGTQRRSYADADSLPNGWDYISFFDRNRPRLLPFRFILIDSGGVTRINSPVTVDNFSWQVQRNGDIAYSITLREYRFIGGT